MLTLGGARTRGLKTGSQDWVSRLGLKTGTGTRCSVSLQFAFLGADGIFTSVNDGYILDISLIYLGYMWRIYCCILFKRYI